MRKVLVIGFVGLVMMACGGEPPVAVAPQPTVTAPPPPPPVDTTPPAPTAPPAPPPKKPLADLQKLLRVVGDAAPVYFKSRVGGMVFSMEEILEEVRRIARRKTGGRKRD